MVVDRVDGCVVSRDVNESAPNVVVLLAEGEILAGVGYRCHKCAEGARCRNTDVSNLALPLTLTAEEEILTRGH